MTPVIAMLGSTETALAFWAVLFGIGVVVGIIWLIVSLIRDGSSTGKWISLGILGVIISCLFPPLGILAVIFGSTAFWIWMLVDCARRIQAHQKDMVVWIVVLALTHVIGTIIYFFVVYRGPPPALAAGSPPFSPPPAPSPGAPPPATPFSPAPPVSPPANPAQGACPKCGSPLATEATEGLCPRCLVQMNLAATAQFAAGASVSADIPSSEPLPAPETIAPNFPQLEILECLGRGGMGLVYKARQPRLNRFVALKILAPGLNKDPQFAERFLREAQALARLNHQNIVTVYDFGESGGMYFLMMEYVDGANLRQLLHGGKIDPAQALSIVPRICEALQYAHEQGIVHRDIKPENVLVDKQGRVKIADFGIARMVGQETALGGYTKGQSVIGTPYYMAPEQVEKPLAVDHRADIYSLGVVFYEMLTGELPMGRFALPSEKVQVDVRLDDVVLRALEKEPQRRYQHASQVKSDVESITAPGGTVPPFVAVKPPVTTPPFAAAPKPEIAAALAEVKGSARVLKILGWIYVIFGIGALFVSIILIGGKGAAASGVICALVGVVTAGLGALVAIGAGKMRRLESYLWSLLATAVTIFWAVFLLIALTPPVGARVLFLPLSFISLIVGIWAFVVLLRENVRQGFAANSPASAPWGAGKTIAVVLGVLLLFFLPLVAWSVAYASNARRNDTRFATFVPPYPPSYYPPMVSPPASMVAPTESLSAGTQDDAAGQASPETDPAVARAQEARQQELETQLRQAQAEMARLQQLVQNGLATTTALNAVREEVDVIKAEQTGDPVKVAEVRLRAAQQRMVEAKSAFDAGLVSIEEYEKAKNAAELRQAELSSAQAQAAAAKETPKAAAAVAINSPATVSPSASPAKVSGPAADLRTRLQAAKLVTSWTAKDNALGSLARDAAESDETTIAIEALTAMASWQARDTAARNAARTIARRGHRADAIRVASLISSVQMRDATLAEISQ